MFPSNITRYVVSPLRAAMNLHHREVKNISKSLDKTQWLQREQLHSLQERKLAKLCVNAYRNTSYYKDVFDQAGLDPASITRENLPKLPILDKSIIRDRFENIVNQSLDRKKLSICTSGGSTGEPIRILQSFHTKAFGAAITQRNNIWTGWYPGRVHHKLWGAVRDLPGEGESRTRLLWNYFYNRHFINAYESSDQVFQEYNESYKRRPPYLLECYSNILYEFAKFIEAGNLEPMRPSAIISSAGTLYDFQRSTIERCFGSELYNRYGCRELGNIAHECSAHSCMHINMERYIIEVDQGDEQGVGELVITDLENQAFPMIRYRICDRGKLSRKECNCGRGLEMLEKVVGRSLDVIKTPDGRKISGEIFIRLFRAFNKVIMGQAVMKTRGHLEVRLKVQNPFSKEEEESFKNIIKKYTGPYVNLNLNYVSHLQTTSTGKYSPVITEYDDE